MNIFFLSTSTRRCARWHCDKHVVKMILEYTQILYTSNHVNGGTAVILADAPVCASTNSRGYKLHAKNHPSVRWATESLAHYMWLNMLALDLVKEHSYRFEPKAIHASYKHLVWLRDNPPSGLRIPTKIRWLRDPPPAMPDEFKVNGRSLDCYRAYYNGAKRRLLKYTKRHLPHIIRAEGC
jgi:hypothetical protein